MKPWESICIGQDTTVLKAVETIDHNSPLLTAIVIDDQGVLLGTITDGDVRRGMLDNVTMEEKVGRIMHKTPIFITNDTSSREIKKIFNENPNCRVLPIIDDRHRVIGIKTNKTPLQVEYNNTVLIMAGGLGTRLRPLTNNTPKPLLHVGNKPILEIILDNFIESGFSDFYISVNYKAEMIEDYFKDGSDRGISIKYLKEKKRLGTAGALSLIDNRPDQPIIVMNGDLLTKVDFQKLLEFHESNRFSATMCVREYVCKIPFGVVRANNCQLEALQEKPTQKMFVNAGIYTLNPTILKMVPPNTYIDMPELFSSILEKGQKPGVFPIREYWLDIGRLNEYEKADKAYAELFQKNT